MKAHITKFALFIAAVMAILVGSCSMGLEPAKNGTTSVSFTFGSASSPRSGRAVAPGLGFLYIRTVGGPTGPKGALYGPFTIEPAETFTTTEIPAGTYTRFGVLYATEDLSARECDWDGRTMSFSELMRLPDDEFLLFTGDGENTEEPSAFELLTDGLASGEMRDNVTIAANKKNQLTLTLVPICGESRIAMSEDLGETLYSETGAPDRLVRKFIQIGGVEAPTGSIAAYITCTVEASESLYIGSLAFFNEEGIQAPPALEFNKTVTEGAKLTVPCIGGNTYYLYVEYHGEELRLAFEANAIDPTVTYLYVTQYGSGTGNGSDTANTMSVAAFRAYLSSGEQKKNCIAYISGDLSLEGMEFAVGNESIITIVSLDPDAAISTITMDENSMISVGSGGILLLDNLIVRGNGTAGAKPLFSTAGALSILSGCTIRDRVNTQGAAGIYVAGGGSVFMDGEARIENCVNTGSAQPGGALYLNGADGLASFFMSGGTIANCSALNGGAISADHNATIVMTGGLIENCNAIQGTERGSGGGVNLYGLATGPSFEMSAGTIRGCTAKYGGAISTYENVAVTIGGGLIEDCTASDNGGAINGCGEDYRTTISILGGTVNRCSAALGGAVSTYQNVSILMEDGLIENCEATGTYGGAFRVYVYEEELPGAYADFTMNGGTISACGAAESGGGLCLDSADITFVMTGGRIESCTAGTGSGGGIECSNIESATMSGGTIESCEAPNGGGLYISGDFVFNFSGGSINMCTASSGGGVSVGSGCTLTLSDPASITHTSPPEESGWAIYAGYGGILNTNPIGGALSDFIDPYDNYSVYMEE